MQKQTVDTTVYDVSAVPEPAQYPGGESALFKFIQMNIHYPPYEMTSEIQGTVFVSFIIDTSGDVTNIKLYKGVKGGPGLDSEAMRIVHIMPKWNPGKRDGKLIREKFILPIKFRELQVNSRSSLQGVMTSSYEDYYSMGVEKYTEGKYRDALTYFKKTLQDEPNNIDALYNASACYLELKQNEKACETLQKIKALGKPDADDLIKKYCSN